MSHWIPILIASSLTIYNVTFLRQGKSEVNLYKPRGGLQFIGGPYAHCYTIGESRLWFPCVDSNTELSTWTLEFTVDARLTGSVQRRL